ncbi:hypothetical protein HF521_002032 [Silurus meridionalis]|uniref:Uncharacterized protein n=1 Tax=Silurus meridionalis TaxID=175797 RepID=A0A8T0B6G8_SILME|nr:hypothetical protein HF521_002032 [Silurus meridionalis]
MWCCKRLWLLLIALVHILDVRALGVWNRRPAQDWYSVDVKMGLDQTQGSSFLPDGGHNSTARRDESKANAGALQNSVVSHAGLSSSDALGTGFSGQSENIFNTIQGFQTQNVGLCAQSTSDQDVPTPEIQTSHGVQSFGMSNHQGLPSPCGGSQTGPAFIVTQQTSENAMSSGSMLGTSSFTNGYQTQGLTGYGLFQGLVSQFGSSQTQPGTNQLSFAPASTVTQQVTDSATTGGSSSFSIPSSPSGSQSPSAYWLSLGLSSPYGGFQTQPGTNQLGSVPASTVTQQVTDSATTGGSSSFSIPSSPSGSQSPSAYWLSLGLSSPYGGFQTQPGTNQLSSAPASTVTQQSAETGPSISPPVSLSSSLSGSQSSTGYGLFQGLSSPYGGFQTQPGTNQLSSAPASTVTQQVTDSATTGGSPSGSQSSTGYGLFQGLSSHDGGFQTQPGTNQLSSAPASTVTQQTQPGTNQLSSVPASTVTQQVTDSGTTGGSSSFSISSSPSGSQSSTGYGLFQGLVNQFGSTQTQPGTNQLSSAPASTVTQQSAETGPSISPPVSLSSSLSGSHSPLPIGFPRPFQPIWWFPDTARHKSTEFCSCFNCDPAGLSSPYGGFQTQPGTNQLSSAPASTVTQQVTDSATTGGSPSGSQSSTGYGLFQGLSSHDGGFQTQPGTNQLSSAPASTVTQQVTDSATTGGSSSFSIPSSPSGSQSSTGYGLFQGLVSQFGSSQTQQGTNQLSSAPASTVTQQSAESGPSISPPVSLSSSLSGSQSPSAYWLSLGLSSPFGGFQTQPGTNQLGSVPASTVTQQVGSSQTQPGTNQLSSAPALTVTQQVTDSATTGGSSSFSISSSPSGSQSSTGYGLFQGLVNQFGSTQTQPGTNQLSSAPASTVTQQSAETGPSISPPVSLSSSLSGSQSSTGYGLFQGLSSHDGGFQTQPGTNQLSSAPASTVTQQVTDSSTTGGSSSFSIPSSPSGSQSPSAYWLSLGLSSPYGGFQTQPGTNQLGSVPASTVTQQVTDSGTTGGSPSGSQSSSGYGLFQGLVSQSGSSQTQPGTNQLSSVPALTVTQQSVESGPSISPPVSLSSSLSGSQSPSAYWLSLGLSSPYGGFQTQQGTNQLSSAPASTVTQQVTGSATTGGSPSGSQSSTGYGLSQQGTNYLGSVTALTSSSASSAFQSQTLSQEQSHNVQQLGTFNQMLPAFWFGHQSCKNNVFSGSSNISKLTSH